MPSRIPAALGFCAALLGLSVIGPHGARAAPLVTVQETAPGQFTLFNNSNNWFIYGFEIERPAFASSPTTTQPGWSAYACTFTCNLSAPAGFGYVLDSFGNPFTAGIAPHASSSSFFFADSGPNIVDGSSNTILFTEALDIVVFAAAQVASIQDGTSNTILFGENGQPTFPVRFGFRGSVRPDITDGTSNTIFIGESFETPLPGALTLFATGLAGLGLIARRRARRASADAATPAGTNRR